MPRTDEERTKLREAAERGRSRAPVPVAPAPPLNQAATKTRVLPLQRRGIARRPTNETGQLAAKHRGPRHWWITAIIAVIIGLLFTGYLAMWTDQISPPKKQPITPAQSMIPTPTPNPNYVAPAAGSSSAGQSSSNSSSSSVNYGGSGSSSSSSGGSSASGSQSQNQSAGSQTSCVHQPDSSYGQSGPADVKPEGCGKGESTPTPNHNF